MRTTYPRPRVLAYYRQQALRLAYLSALRSAGQPAAAQIGQVGQQNGAPAGADSCAGACCALLLDSRPESDRAPAGAVVGGGGLSVVIEPNVQHKSQDGRGSHVALI